MANYANLLATIAANIYTNNNNEVTAAMVKSAVDAMVASMGAGYQFNGIATPATNPSNPDAKQFYIACQPGTYTNFGGATVEKYELAILKGSGNSWTKEVASDGSEFRTIESRVGSKKLLYSGTVSLIDVPGEFKDGDRLMVTVGNGANEAIEVYGFRADSTFSYLGSVFINNSRSFVLTEDFVTIRIASSTAHPITLERVFTGEWEPICSFLAANYATIYPVLSDLNENWPAIGPECLRTYQKTATSSGVYPQINWEFDVRDGEWFNLTPVASEQYIIWSDYSYTRIYGGWQKMTYPAGKTLLYFRQLVSPEGTTVTATMQVMPEGWKAAAEYIVGTQTNMLPQIRALILGDSYSDAGGGPQWMGPMVSKLPPGSSYISLAVSGATLRDRYADRTTYPYTSRPVSTDNTGNKNTLACQVEKLKRLMEGSDLDPGEAQIYADPATYPNVIIIAAGKNDNPDTASAVSTYASQLNKIITGVYRKQKTEDAASIGDMTIKTPAEELDRMCFAGAYRHLLDELLALFPDAQIYFATVSPIGYPNGVDVCEKFMQIAAQQRECADMFSASVIDWHRDGQINFVANYPEGSGTADDPYIWGESSLPNRDTNDLLHPNDRGDKKYGHLAASVIRATFMDIENF